MLRRMAESRWTGPAALALVSYLPLILTRRGLVVADTKQYLFLDPGEVLAASTSLWDPDWALGTVTHQSVGYLWPMGPWFWFFETIGAPDWVAQRLWIGSILFAAGMGVRFLGRTFGWSRGAALAAAFVYLLSPYPLAYATRISVLVLPWAALPWLVAFGVRALRRGGWRDPLAIALVGTTVGSVNASSLLYAGIAVILWFPFAVLVSREVGWRHATETAVRVGAALVAACLWWIVALAVQSRHGADVLQFSETLDVVASGSPSSEAWRGLGYWVFYGGDRTGLWVTAAQPFTQNPLLLAATFLAPMVTAVSLFVVRWRDRAYFLLLAVVGLILTIGFHPYDKPGGLLALVRDDVADTGLALALRSSPRALPLFLLAAAASIAALIDALPAGRVRIRVAVSVVVLAGIAVPPLWTGRYVGTELARDEAIDDAWLAAAAHLNAGDPNSRVLVLPGADFSAHRWGNTIDHILPGLIERPAAVRELVAFGPPASADLLIALDRGGQEGMFEPAAVAPIARLLGAGDVVVQNDLEYERYRLPRPDAYWAAIETAAGFDGVTTFGPPTANVAAAEFPLRDEVELSLPPELPAPPPVAALSVADPLGVIRARPAAGVVIVSGDGEALVDLAVADVLPADRLIVYEASLTDAELAAALDAGAEIVITDGNRLEARRWKTVRDNRGLTEQIGGDGLRDDPTDARLDVFPDAAPASFTTARHDGVTATATAYGNPIAYHAEDRAAHAVDGDPTTAWRVAAFSEARGESITLRWPEPVASGSVTLVQPQTLNRNRYITEVDISVNGQPFERYSLGPPSLSLAGETLELGVAEVESIEIRVWETSAGRRPGYGGLSPVGFAEIDVDGSRLVETIVMAPALAQRVAEHGATPSMTVVISRERAVEVRDDPETLIRREFTLPAPGVFDLVGTAGISHRAPDQVLADVLGLDPAVRAVASDRLVGGVAQSAAMVLDGDESTAWMPPFGPQVGQWVELEFDEPQRVDHVDLAVWADGRHSVPTIVEVVTDTGSQVVELGAVADDLGRENAEAWIDVPIAAVTTSSLRLRVVEVRETRTIDWFSASEVVMPIAIAEVAIDGVAPNPAHLEPLGACRSDLLFVDGEPFPVRLVTGSSITDRLAVETCGSRLTLDAGTHLIETKAGRHEGIDIDRLTLRSTGPVTTVQAPPEIDVVEHGRGEATVAFRNATEPFWLVLGESYEPGWRAQIGGVGLDGPSLVDGFANGWYIDPAIVGATGTVELVWEPNRTVRRGMLLSLALTLVLVWLAWRRPGRVLAVPDPRLELGPTLRLDPGRRHRLMVAVGAAVATAAISRVWIGGLVGMVTFFACDPRPVRRGLLGVLAIGSLALMGLYVVGQQVRFGGPHDGAWTALWGRPHLLGWVALGAVIGELSIELLDRVCPDPDLGPARPRPLSLRRRVRPGARRWG